MNASRKKHWLAREWENIKQVKGRARWRYLWDYYKFPFLVLCIFVYMAAYIIYGQLTRKETVLYTAFVNVAPGEEITRQLSTDFLESQGINLKKNEFYLYSGLYLTNDEHNPYHEYTYASRIKILAAIDNEQLDVILVNKEALYAFSQSGYLCSFKELLSGSDTDLYELAAPYITADGFGLDISRLPLIKNAGFNDTVYLGIIANSPRLEMAINYLRYLTSSTISNGSAFVQAGHNGSPAPFGSPFFIKFVQ